MVSMACINIHLWIWAAGRIILSYSCNVSVRWKYELRKTFIYGVIDFIVIDECTGCIISCIYSTMAQPRLYSATTVWFIGYILSLAKRYFGVLFIFYRYLSTYGLTIENVMLLIFAPSFDIFKMCRILVMNCQFQYTRQLRLFSLTRVRLTILTTLLVDQLCRFWGWNIQGKLGQYYWCSWPPYVSMSPAAMVLTLSASIF